MNSELKELIEKLENKKAELQNFIRVDLDELTKLKSSDKFGFHKLRIIKSSDKFEFHKLRIKFLEHKLSPYIYYIEHIRISLDFIMVAYSNRKNLEEKIRNTTDSAELNKLKEMLDNMIDSEISSFRNLQNRFGFLLDKDFDIEDLRKKSVEYPFDRKKMLSVILSCLILVNVMAACSNQNQYDESNETEQEDVLGDESKSSDDLDPELDEEEKDNSEALTFTDINDEEQVSLRAFESMQDLDRINNGHDHTIDEIENIMRWMNGGVPESISQQDALFAVTRLETLWNRENQREVNEVFNISKLFKDGSRGQKLANKIYDIRVRLMNAVDEAEYRKVCEEFAVLFINSWKLNGTNNEISAYELETSFMEATIDKYFLNTYASIHAENIKVTVSNVEFLLDEVAVEVNEANCPATIIADNGDVVETYVNKFSSDMIGAVTEATIAKNESNRLVK